mmetsp:Transcript_37777/g.43152  ORF Transcript_37777/g.43152 Transcript_37777/m.43152 type:complete len:178 (-) Transcript_37777:135-668(-)|eukprot:CAMPEP_0194170810 /NCGR_PEP_ID=MMETSP0154-20130528/5470_1 /TAXON_ID=1049557 /ORGANISM="Thalassiothrix antarctica, Strain L6-D1" /LENGTH=177 /DNA_ID=CAMNT_0038882855 /DNA_START=49 /DNA_END=582 /DNA_ORIENTATION=-
MAKKDNKSKAPPTSAGKASKKSIARREVLVVQCPTDFPSHSEKSADNTRLEDSYTKRRSRKRKEKHLDWSQTAREIHSYGATAFKGKQKRDYENEQYKMLTGREKKQQKVPVKIVRGIKKKRVQREKREAELAREAGLVVPESSMKKSRERQHTRNVHGPEPSIGRLRKGVLKVRQP